MEMHWGPQVTNGTVWVSLGHETWNYVEWEALRVNYEYGKSNTWKYQQITEEAIASARNISSFLHLRPKSIAAYGLFL